MRPYQSKSSLITGPLLAIFCMLGLTCGAYAQQGVSGSLTAGTGSAAYLEFRGAPANPQIGCALNAGANCSILFAPQGTGGFNFQNGNGGNSVQILGTSVSPGDTLQYLPNSAGPAVFTASIGAAFTGTGNGTSLTATPVTGVIHPGNASTASITGSGVPGSTYIVSQISGTPGGTGVYATNNPTTSSGASITSASATMDVTGTTSGTIAVGQSDSGIGIASGTALIAFIGGSTGNVGTYTISPLQYAPNTTVTALGSTVTLETSNSAPITLNPSLALTGDVAFNNNGIGAKTQQKFESTFNVTGIDSDIGQQGAGIFNIRANLQNSANFASAPPAMSVTTQQLGTGYASGLVGLQVSANLTSTPTNIPSTWAATTTYTNGSMMYDANADLFQTFTGGTTGSIAPTLTTCNPSCADGTVTWNYTGSYLFGLAGTVASQDYGQINANQGGTAAATMGTGWGLLGGIVVGTNGTYTQAATAQELDIKVTPTGTAAPGSLVGLGIYTQAAGQGRFADTALSIAGTPGNYRKNAVQFGTTLDPNAGVGLSVYDSRGYAQYGAGLIDCSQCGNFAGTQSQFGNDAPFILKSPYFNLLATGDMRIGYGLIHVASNGFNLDVPNYAVTGNTGFGGGTGWINGEEACDTLGNCGTIAQSGGVPSGITVYTGTYIPGSAVPGATPVAWHAVSISSPGPTGGTTEGTPFTTIETYAQASSPTIGIGGASATAVNLGNSGSTTTVAGALRATGTTTLVASGTALSVTNNAIVGGSLVIGSPTGGSQGPGTLNVPALFVNGVPVTGGGGGTPGGSTSDLQFYGVSGFAGDSTLTFNTSAKQLGASALQLSGSGTALNVTNNATVGGSLVIGSPTGGSQGSGTLNVPALFVNGVSVTGSAGGTPGGSASDLQFYGAGGFAGDSTLTFNASAKQLGASSLLLSGSGTALNITNNGTVGGTLGVTGTSTLGTVNGSGAATFSGSGTGLAVTNNASVGGTLGVTGTLTASGGITGTLTGGASLDLPLVGGTVTGTSTFNYAGTALTLGATSNATIGGTLGVTGISTLGSVNGSGAATFSGSGTGLAVTNNAAVGGSLGVTGTLTASGGITGTLTGGASLDLPLAGGTVTGASAFNYAGTALTLGTTSNATIGGTLGVTGTSTLGTVNAGGLITSSTGSTYGVQMGNIGGAGSVVAATGTGNVNLNLKGLGQSGAYVQDATGGNLLRVRDNAGGTAASSYVTINALARGGVPTINATGGGNTSIAVNSTAGAVMTFSAITGGSVAIGDVISDITNPSAIPSGTTVSAMTGTTATASTASISPSSGDAIAFAQQEVPLTLSSLTTTGQSPVNITGGMIQNLASLTGITTTGGPNGYPINQFRTASDHLTQIAGGTKLVAVSESYGGGNVSGTLSSSASAVLTFGSAPGALTGMVAYDATTPAAFPTNTTVANVSGTTVTLSTSSITPSNGDTIQFLPTVGQRGGLQVYMQQTGNMGDLAAGQTQPGGVGLGSEVASAFPATVGSTSTNQQGLLYSTAATNSLQSGATNWAQVIGDEHDINTDIGSSYGVKTFQKWVLATDGAVQSHGSQNDDIFASMVSAKSGAYSDFGLALGRDNANWPFDYSAAITNGGKGSVLIDAQLGADWLTRPDAPALGGIGLNQVMFATPAQGGFAFRSNNMRIGSDGSYGVGAMYLSSTGLGGALDVTGATATGTPSIVAAGSGYSVGARIQYRDGIWKVTSVNGSGGVTGIVVYTDGNGNARQPSYPANIGLPGTVTPYTDAVDFSKGATGLQIGLSWTTPGTLALGATTATAINIGNSGSTTTIAGTLAVGVTTLSVATTTYTPDGSNNDYSIALTSACASAACTLANPSKTPVAGTDGFIFVTQPASGGAASFGTWGSDYQAPGGTTSIVLSTTANAVDVLHYVVKDSTHILVIPSLDFSH